MLDVLIGTKSSKNCKPRRKAKLPYFIAALPNWARFWSSNVTNLGLTIAKKTFKQKKEDNKQTKKGTTKSKPRGLGSFFSAAFEKMHNTTLLHCYLLLMYIVTFCVWILIQTLLPIYWNKIRALNQSDLKNLSLWRFNFMIKRF